MLLINGLKLQVFLETTRSIISDMGRGSSSSNKDAHVLFQHIERIALYFSMVTPFTTTTLLLSPSKAIAYEKSKYEVACTICILFFFTALLPEIILTQIISVATISRLQ